MDDYKPHQDSTYALTLFRYEAKLDGEDIVVGELNELLEDEASHV
jgi:hypothetical protein